MPNFRLLLQRTPVTDPEAIARGAQALLDLGSQVRLLTPRLWVYTPLVADYRRVTVTWAGPGAQPRRMDGGPLPERRPAALQ